MDQMRRLCWEEERGVARLPQRQTSYTAADWPTGGRINQTHVRARAHAHTQARALAGMYTYLQIKSAETTAGCRLR